VIEDEAQPSLTGVTFSIVIGLVSTEDRERILETLDALRNQRGDHSFEVILADRRDDRVSAVIRRDYPEVRLIDCPAETSLPELRTIALDQAQGAFLAVTEDHCVPSADWLDAVSMAFREAPDGTVAVGGCVENGVADRALDWATFLCEYSACLPPVAEGPAQSLPGMNVVYRRKALAELERSRLIRGFWETTVHPELLRRGLTLYSTNRVVMNHSKKFSFRLFVHQRFLYSKYFAGIRFERGQIFRRAAAAALSLLLPAVLLCRIAGQVWRKRRHKMKLLVALPALSLFVVIWSLGEMAGYVAGAGDALSRIE